MVAAAFLVGAAGAAVLVGAPSASAAPGLVTVTLTSAPTGPADYFRYADAYCPAGTNVVGGGAAVVGDASAGKSVHIDVITNWTPSGLQASAKEHDASYPGSWAVRVTAICGVVSGWQAIHVTQVIPAGGFSGSATATCPGSKKVIGAGGGTSKNHTFKLTSIKPSDDLTSVTVKTISVAPAAFEHHVSAVAICIDPLPGQQLVTATSATGPFDKAVNVACPAGTKVHGTGGGVIGSGGYPHITRLDTFGLARINSVRLEAATSNPGPFFTGWTAIVYAICAA